MRHVLDQMSGKMRQMENVIRALQAQVPPPEPPEDEETAKLRLAREQFVANQKLREAAEPPAPRLPDPNQVFDARLRSVEVALAEVRDYMARSVTPVTQQMPPPPRDGRGTTGFISADGVAAAVVLQPDGGSACTASVLEALVADALWLRRA